jgi:hypothetical protein
VEPGGIRNNRLGELSTSDDRLLGERLSEPSKLELDFSLDVIGFEIPKIGLLIEGAPSQPDPVDRIPRVPSGPAVCRPGDLWELGPHLIYCGGALDEASYAVLMGENGAAMVFATRFSDRARH